MGGHHVEQAPSTHALNRVALAVIVPIAALTLAAMALLWPGELEKPGEHGAEESTGQVTAIERQTTCDIPAEEDVNGCGSATVILDDGEQVETQLPNGPGAPEISERDKVVLIHTETPDGEIWSVVDHQRGTQLWILMGAFALALVAFGRWKGVTALAGLAVTFVVLLWFVVPALLDGSPPLLVAIVGSAAIMLTVLYLTHGFRLSTTVALLGTLASLVLTGLLSAGAVSFLYLTGVTDDVSTAVGTLHHVNMQGLLLAGIVIGSLGVLDDVTVTQAATVEELAAANPDQSTLQLYRAADRVGRSHIASVVNTIILAYAGSSLPLLIMIVATRDPLGSVVTDQLIAQEIVRSVVATLGLVAAVPITTALAAWAFTRSRPERSHP